MTLRTIASLTVAVALFAAGTDRPADAQAPADEALIKKARAVHDKVIALDTHDDISPANFTLERNYTQRLENQVNLPKMVEGGLDAAFFIVYVGQGALTQEGYDRAYQAASEKFDAIHRLTKEIAPDKIGLALTSEDARRLNAQKKKIAFIGVENGYPLGDEKTAIARVREFHQRGARYLSLAHNGHSQLADSNTGEATGEWLHNGLSPLGKQVIEELNRVGIMVDLSHPSKEANLQAMALSKAPVIASHSGARSMCNHSRNMDDELLLALKKNGGVAQAVALASYVKTPPPQSPERVAALNKLAAEFGLPEGSLGRGGRGGGGRGRAGATAPPAAGTPPATGTAATGSPAAAGTPQGRGRGGALAQLSEEKRTEVLKRVAEIDKQFPPPPRATVKDFVDHIDYIVKKIGIDHVGISSDFDGGGGIDGWSDASETFNVTLEMVRRGYTEQQIAKIWSGNLLRVLDQVQKVAKDLQKRKS